MTVKELIATYPITLKLLREITQNPKAKLSDEVSEFGIGFMEGYTYHINRNNVEHNAKFSSHLVKEKINTKIPKTSKKTQIKKKAKKRKSSVWAISVPMGGDTKWKRKKSKINS